MNNPPQPVPPKLDERRAWLDGRLNALGCAQCAEHDPCCLRFHRVDLVTRDVLIERVVKLKMMSIGELKAFVGKLEATTVVLCASCRYKTQAWIGNPANDRRLQQLAAAKVSPIDFLKHLREARDLHFPAAPLTDDTAQ
jgi:hypothetical protein